MCRALGCLRPRVPLSYRIDLANAEKTRQFSEHPLSGNRSPCQACHAARRDVLAAGRYPSCTTTKTRTSMLSRLNIPSAEQAANTHAQVSWNGRSPTHEFTMPYEGAPCKVLFTAVAGHVKETVFPPGYEWGKCPHGDLLDEAKVSVHWQVPQSKRGLASNLRRLSSNSQTLILWLDCDSEGEKIAQDVADVCCEGNRNLAVRRARFSAMTHTDIMRAMRSLVVLDKKTIAMVSTRQEVDLRAGAAYTRFLTDCGRKFDIPDLSGRDSSVLSYGPCQFPTLGLVVDRWLTIKSFKSRPFWVFQLRMQDCSVQFDWARARLFEDYTAHALYELCLEDCARTGNVARVERVEKRVKRRYRPVPLSTVELQKAASRLLRLSSDATVKAAEALYASGLISYPRTETNRFDPSYDLRSFVGIQSSNMEWGSFASRLLAPQSEDDPVTFQWPPDGGSDDKAHPPIHPIAAAPANFESSAQQKVYNFIAKRFLASCSIDAQGSETKAQVRVGRAEFFGARGLIVEVQGYLEVMAPLERWSERSMPVQLLERGAAVPIVELSLHERKTQPPPLLAEADLIALMDNHGIGTDATIAQHIDKVKERGYVKMLGDRRFEPTDLGVALVEAFERSQILLARPGMRRAQEENFKKVLSGEMQSAVVKHQALSQFMTTFQRLRASGATVETVFGAKFAGQNVTNWEVKNASFSKCGGCSSIMSLKTKREGQRLFCSLHCDTCAKVLTISRNTGNKQYKGAQGAGSTCILCQYQVLIGFNPGTGKEHSFCPSCLNSPPSDASVNPEKLESGQFRCFNCSATGCPNASGTPPNRSGVAKCPKASCGAPCAIRSNISDGVEIFRVCCTKPRNTCSWRPYFFPRSVADVKALEDLPPCPICGSKQLEVSWKRASLVPGQAPSFTGCVWCGSGYRSCLESMGNASSFVRIPHPGAPETVDIEGRGAPRGRYRGGSAAGGMRRGESGHVRARGRVRGQSRYGSATTRRY